MNRIVWLLLVIVFHVGVVDAKPLSQEQVPEPLKPWIPWALQNGPEPDCPFTYDHFEQKRCGWPTETRLELSNGKGAFSMIWTVYRDTWAGLPGDRNHWPLNVTVDGHAALVMDKNGVPSVKLKAGKTYQIKGGFSWSAVPDNLSLPADTGLIGLSINGQTITTPTIKNGRLWLKESETGQKKAENVQNNADIQVFRKIVDDVPATLLTRLVLEVSGEQRELTLPKIIPDGFIPLSMHSSLPARLEAGGQLLLQLRPGRWQIDLTARNSRELTELPLHTALADNETQGLHWPEAEIWVFEAMPELRVVEIEQLSAVDTNMTNLPGDWRNLPAYKIAEGQAMVFKTIRRGDPDPEPNRLDLHRKLWLDFDGEGYTVNDSISGTMTRGWRLNALPETRLGKVSLNGNNQFITKDRSGKEGVEVRSGAISLNADSRITGGIASTGAVGWEQDFHSVRAELNLPPGWRLLAAGGVDNVPDSWVAHWTLRDLFLVLIAALATGRLWNRYWGALALVTLVLIWYEPDAPQFVWLNILAATALVKLLPPGKFLKFMTWYRNAFWLVLIMIALPFMVNQVRTGLYPQLEKPWLAIDTPGDIYFSDLAGQVAEEALPASAPEPVFKEERKVKAQKRMKSSAQEFLSFDLAQQQTDFERIDPKAKVQTGPGLPQWRWNKVELYWNGAVDSGQQLHLWYLTPAMTMVLNFVRVILLSILVLLMFGIAEKFRFNFKLPKASANVLLWFLLVPLCLMPVQALYADLPDKALLDDLRARMLEAPEPPDCLPGCAEIQQMKVALNEHDMTLALVVHAAKAIALPLPARYEQWFPNQVTVDGKAAAGLYRDGNGLWLQLDEGEHQVTMSGSVPLLSKFTLPLPLKPKWVGIQSEGWQVVGWQENSQVDEQLQFSRVNRSERRPSEAALEQGALPPFVRIERTLQLGLDWRVLTRVVRVSPPDSAIVLAVPLMPGESVTSEGIRVKDGKVELNMAANQAVFQWQSSLEKSEKIEFTATNTEQWIEVLRADIGPIWHVDTSGIAMMHLNNSGVWLPEWHPWPGESVILNITRPEAVDGQTLTIDNSSLTVTPGQRGREVELTFTARSSQGVQHTLLLPEQAVLQQVSIDGRSQPIRLEGNKLTVPLSPGSQRISVGWREAEGIGAVMKTPKVDLGTGSVNANLHAILGEDRWVLFTMGPKLGPAVLFWGVLIVIVIISPGLAKIPLTPLNWRQWLLLLIGLSQIPLASGAVVVAWLMLLGLRKKQSLSGRLLFNTSQILLGLLTLTSLSLLFSAVNQGLLHSPDMQIVGNQSSAYDLRWYQDRSSPMLPVATVVSVPTMVYRLLMLAWSLWLAAALLDWLKWGWSCFADGGFWRKRPPQATPAEAAEPKTD